MIRGLVWLAVIVGVIVLGSTVPLGKRTLFGHISAVWNTKEATEMRDGIADKAAPAVDRVKRGVEAGVEAASDDGSGSAGSGSGSAGSGSGSATPPRKRKPATAP